ncbi:LacI family DNA-binding transcriptional regulator [Paratractidigestivibacter sp.]|uniref:LacI family DNA-binding transcriptional regulator n=1 Tax=Paratractidigestivibacter sp. TaxID=2847316 RepID=UPI002AC9552D|nr:LacI family DNA-binding transcriptional regulator [Paratractidigestivibacter sp.]
MARVRIKDIAEQAGVSAATVSRYLNNTPGAMTDETRARIAEVVARTGYRPLAAARSLRTDRSQLLGVVLADISNPYSSAMLEALSHEAAAQGYSLMTAVTGNDAEAEAAAVDRLVAAGADALVVNTCGENDRALREANLSLPVVLLDRDVTGGGLDLVTSNNKDLVAGLVGELAGCGCKKLFLVSETNQTSSIRRERAARFLEETGRLGVEGRVVELRGDKCGWLAEAGEKCGYIAINGLVFLRLVEALQANEPQPAGIDGVPVRIATFDDFAWNRVIAGGVTTAAQDIEGIARTVVERALSRIENPEAAPRRFEIAGQIIRRSSTARLGG